MVAAVQTPEALVSAGQARSAEEKHRDSQELEALRQREQAEKRSRTLQRGTRYSHADVQLFVFFSEDKFYIPLYPKNTCSSYGFLVVCIRLMLKDSPLLSGL